MGEELCSFCSEPERVSIKPNGKEYHFKPREGHYFVCSKCTLILCKAEQGDLKKAHAKAVEKGHNRKVMALEMFIIEEEFDVRKAKKSKRDMVRERPLRSARSSRNKVRA